MAGHQAATIIFSLEWGVVIIKPFRRSFIIAINDIYHMTHQCSLKKWINLKGSIEHTSWHETIWHSLSYCKTHSSFVFLNLVNFLVILWSFWRHIIWEISLKFRREFWSITVFTISFLNWILTSSIILIFHTHIPNAQFQKTAVHRPIKIYPSLYVSNVGRSFTSIMRRLEFMQNKESLHRFKVNMRDI